MTGRRPRIVTAWSKPDYEAALAAAGADVRVLDATRDPLPASLDDADGVMLTGGVDVDPARYGSADRHPTVEIDAARDAYELALARETLARGLPLLAICRGAQVLNVAAGGTLIQDIPSAHPSRIDHAVNEPKDAIAHDVTVTPGSALAGALDGRLDPAGRIAVNSRHHQAVDRVAPGFVASAVAPDGIIEAIEKPDGTLCLGVQWHPENFWRTGQFTSLFAALVHAAARHRA
ncbi:MAG: gamma-glutamyl-gamma-aminobutyrate hydrolase family protein [Vicinamibacterales bacterium]